MSDGVAYDLDGLCAADVNAIARIYDDVVAAVGEAAMTRSARVEVLARLVADARSGRLDPFVSRERAFATLLRHPRIETAPLVVVAGAAASIRPAQPVQRQFAAATRRSADRPARAG